MLTITINSDTITSSDSDFISVKKEEKWGLVDLDGKIIIPCEYDHIIFSRMKNQVNPHFRLYNNNKIGIMDINGTTILPCEYGAIVESEEGENRFFIVEKDYKWYALSVDGKTTLPFEYEETDEESNDDNVRQMFFIRNGMPMAVNIKKVK